MSDPNEQEELQRRLLGERKSMARLEVSRSELDDLHRLADLEALADAQAKLAASLEMGEEASKKLAAALVEDTAKLAAVQHGGIWPAEVMSASESDLGRFSTPPKPMFDEDWGAVLAVSDPALAGGGSGGGIDEPPSAWAAIPEPESADNAEMADTVSRSELDAKLDALRQEMRADSAALRGDFATMSASINQSVATMAVSVADLKGNLQGGLGEIRGSVDGLKSSITMLQWMLAMAAAVVGIVVAYAQLRQAEAPPPAPAPQPIIINVPPAGQIQVPPAAVPQQKSQGDKGNG